ncbi:hypothetical protein LCGC14_0313490 [marine sediment metagenome]|uniref:Phage tail tape measure protein domain-containing protein n=1 Tax=marine sediment metagenome TaxID=412755 RepID=A0A0F9U446_9ZZZZ
MAEKVEVVINATGNLSREMQKASRSTETLGRTIKNLAIPVAAVGAAVIALGATATKMAGDFEAGIREVASLLPDGERQIESLTEKTLALSKALGVDAIESTKALYQAISAGVPAENVFEFMEVATKAAIAGVTETEVAVTALTGVINAFSLPMSDAQRIADILFTTVKGGVVTFEELTRSIAVVAPIAASTGISIEEVAAAITTMTKQNIPARVATSALRQAIANIITPSSQAIELATDLGIAFNAEGLEAKGLVGLLQDVDKATGGNITKMAKLFGSVEALQAVLALTGEGAGKFAADYEAAMTSAGAATEAFNTINAGFNRQMERLAAAIQVVFIEIGTKLLPILSPLIERMIEFATSFDPSPIINAIELLADNMVEIGVTIGVMTAGAAIAFGIMQAAAIRAAIATALAFLPITLALAAITAAVFLFVKAWRNNWGDIQGIVETVAGNILGFFKAMAAAVINLFGIMVNRVIDSINDFIRAYQELRIFLNQIPGFDLPELKQLKNLEIEGGAIIDRLTEKFNRFRRNLGRADGEDPMQRWIDGAKNLRREMEEIPPPPSPPPPPDLGPPIDQARELQDIIRAIADIPLFGETAVGDELFRMSIDAKKLQLAIAEAGGRGAEGIEPLENQLKELRRQMDIVRLRGEIAFDPANRMIDRLVNSIQEMTVQEKLDTLLSLEATTVEDIRIAAEAMGLIVADVEMLQGFTTFPSLGILKSGWVEIRDITGEFLTRVQKTDAQMSRFALPAVVELGGEWAKVNQQAETYLQFLEQMAGVGFVLGPGAPPTPREHGGPVSAGRPFLVGERGPELFIPRTNGSISPNISNATDNRNVTINIMGGSPREVLDKFAVEPRLRDLIRPKPIF